MQQVTIDLLAEAAIAELGDLFTRGPRAQADGRVRPPVLGLGAGKTAARVVRLLSEKYRVIVDGDRPRGDEPASLSEPFVCVAASDACESLAHELGLPVIDFATCDSLDAFIDGADEIDRQMNVMKGSRGAMARERMLAWASRRNIYMVGEHKVSEKIGERQSLGVAVMAFGLESIRSGLRELGLVGVVRRTMNGDLFITDNGNLVLDCDLAGDENLDELRSSLNDIPGVIDHGLFLEEADIILVEHRDLDVADEDARDEDIATRVERLVRANAD